MNFKMLQFFQNLNKNIKDIISWCKIEFKSFIILIFIICLLYNIVFISYMEENIDCFAECSLKEEDESILLKEINELKILKIEALNIEENIEEEEIKNIILYFLDILDKIQKQLINYVILHLIYYLFDSLFFLSFKSQIKYKIYSYVKDFYIFNKVYFYIKLLDFFILTQLDCYIMLGACFICEKIVIYCRNKFLNLDDFIFISEKYEF